MMLSMLMALSVGMVIAMSSQTLIGGYYRNFRGSFYAADSGLNIAVHQIENQLVAGVPATFASPPLSTAQATTLAGNAVSAVASSYGSSTSLNAGSAGQSWKGSFKIASSTVSLVGPGVPTKYNTTVCNAAGPPANGYAYQYNYTVTAVGTAQGTEQQSVTETGVINLAIDGQATTNCISFAYFGAFIDYYKGGIGPLVPGTMTGPMFTNTAWEFMPPIAPWTAPYIFTDPVGQVQSQVYYWNTSWGYNLSSATSYGSGANLVAPKFEQGLLLNQPPVPLPTNSFNQEEAVVDGAGNNSSWTTSGATGLQTLTNVASASWTNATTKGIFMNQGTTATACGSKTPPCMNGGGFYIEGGADVQMIPSGASAQQYVITQGATKTTITVDPSANGGVGSTVIAQQGGPSETLSGVPMNTLSNSPAAMVYVDGTVTIHGPGEGQGAVQDNAMINITANGDIIATGDVLYKTEPVTVPQDTLVAATSSNPMNQVLGLYTAVGNFITQDTQADQNIQVDGSIATISQADSANSCAGGKGGQLSNGHINTFNNVGGMIQSCIYAADVNTENTWFDRRFTARPGFAPPWFPSTTLTQGGPLAVNVTPSIQRLQWLNTSAQ